MNTSFFGELLQSISERGRKLIGGDRRGDAAARSASLVELCEELLSGRGEASGVALAREILTRYDELTTGPRIAFFETLATQFGVDRERIDAAVDAWTRLGTDEAAAELHLAAEPRRQELFRRLNMAPGGTAALVEMRKELLKTLRSRPHWAVIDRKRASGRLEPMSMASPVVCLPFGEAGRWLGSNWCRANSARTCSRRVWHSGSRRSFSRRHLSHTSRKWAW